MPDRRLRIGIWAGWDDPVDWVAEEALRLLTLLIEGAAERRTVTFCVHVSLRNYTRARQVLLGLAAREGADWTLTTDSWTPSLIASFARWLRRVGAGWPPHIIQVRSVRMAETAGRSGPRPWMVGQERPDFTVARGWLLRRSPGQMRWMLLGLLLFMVPAQLLRVLLRPIWRALWRNGLSAMPNLMNAAKRAWRAPTDAAVAIAQLLEQKPFKPLRAFGHELRDWASEARYSVTAEHEHAVSAAALPLTSGWLLLRTDFVRGLGLPGRKIALFSDAFPSDLAIHLDAAWQCRTAETLAGVDGVVTLSCHVAERHVTGFFGVPKAKVAPIPTAMPDLWPLLPISPHDRVSTPDSRRAAADILRSYAAEREQTYLIEFPFEDVPYIVVPAQDHPTKNVALALEAVRLLLRRDYFDIKLLTTANLEPGRPSGLWQAVHDGGMQLEALSVPDLPRAVHAALYHCAALTVHPSFVESGVGCLDFAESISVGTPCLMALGPHSLELLDEEPALQPFLFDPYDADALAHLIRCTVVSRPAALAVQDGIRKRRARRGWGDVGEEFAAVVSGMPVGGAIPPAGHFAEEVIAGSRSQS